MLIKMDAARRPPVFISEADKTRLANLLDAVSENSPAAAVLGEEVERAAVVSDLSALRFVRLGSQAEIEILNSGRVRTVRLSMPDETDIDAGDLSVLTLAGAALVGLSEGAAFSWTDPHGRRQTLRVLRIMDEGDDGGPSAA